MLTIALIFAFEESPELCNLTTLSLSSYFLDVEVGRSLNIFELSLESPYSAKLDPPIYRYFSSYSFICAYESSINKYNTDYRKKA
jgi:hypothetical protein